MDIVKANVLIDETEHARLADFGLLTIISDATNLVSSTSFVQGGTYRWMSPELFDPENFGLKDGRPTKISDCYALGMLIYETLSGKMPFSRYQGYLVVAKILKGERPVRPQGAHGTWFTDEVWDTLERCWNPIPGDRPRINDVLQCLENASKSWTSSRTVAGLPATDWSPHNPDSSGEESTDEGEVSSPSQEVSSQPSQHIQNGDPDENDTSTSALPPSGPNPQDLEAPPQFNLIPNESQAADTEARGQYDPALGMFTEKVCTRSDLQMYVAETIAGILWRWRSRGGAATS